MTTLICQNPNCNKSFTEGRDPRNIRHYCCKKCSQIGAGILYKERAKEQKILKEIEYLKNPNVCTECSGILSYKRRGNKFCSQSCSAKHSNAKRVSKSSETHKRPIDISKYHSCLNNCGNITRNIKFCCAACRNQYKDSQNLADIAAGTALPKTAKKYLLSTLGHKCNRCGNTEWLGKPITIELEHIDGNSENNNLNNLELLCPNCHSMTPTYKNKNKGHGRHARRIRYAGGKSY